ncbi:MAG: hypothetical protein ABI472_19295 [Ginsengibacter sp.]
MKPVTAKVANECIAQYNSTLKSLPKAAQAGEHTTSVAFPSKELMKWLKSVTPHMSELRVVFGEYTHKHVPAKAGRLTVFLWPYDAQGNPAKDQNNKLINPVNLGDLTP